MLAAFSSPLPILHRASPLQTSPGRRTPRLTADPPTETRIVKKTRPPSPLQPTEVLTTALTASLHALFNLSKTPEEAFSFLPDETAWHSPLFDLTATEIPSTLTTFLSFAIRPTFTVFNVDTAANSFNWTLSFDYPLPWRPRVAVAGVTTADSLERPTNITDQWYVNPITLVAQALPRIPDLIWLYPGPHAETDAGLRQVLCKRKEYQLVRFAPRAEVRVRSTVKSFEKELMFATPTLPEQVFEGGLRRREKYSAVSPIALREINDEVCEYAVPVPSLFCGSGDVLLPPPGGEGVNIEIVDERIMAVVRFGGFATRDIVDTNVETIRSALEKEGVIVRRENFWVRVYDSKVGFNERGLLSMAMYGSSTGIPRRNEIAIDITGLVDEEFWKR